MLVANTQNHGLLGAIRATRQLETCIASDCITDIMVPCCFTTDMLFLASWGNLGKGDRA